MKNWNEDYISWKSIPEHSSSSSSSRSSPSSSSAACTHNDEEATSFLTSALIPRPTAWIAVYPSQNQRLLQQQQQLYKDVDDQYDQPLVSLIEGYSGASDRPPTLMLGSDSIPPEVLSGLRENRVCTLSVATERERMEAKNMAAQSSERSGPAKTFEGAGLVPCSPPSILGEIGVPKNQGAATDGGGGGCSSSGGNYFRRPPAVDSSPVQMHCRLILDVPLLPQTPNDDKDQENQNERNNIPSMIFLQIDTYVIKGNTLRTQSTLHPNKMTYLQGNPDVRGITAKIDCLLLRPLGSLGDGRFGRVDRIYHMGRPRPLFFPKDGKRLSKSQMLINSCKPGENTGESTTATSSSAVKNPNGESYNNNEIDWESGSMWEIDGLTGVDSTDNVNGEGDGDTITYTYRIDSSCPLGYNPMKQVVCPRMIGWISTYEASSSMDASGDGVQNNSQGATTSRKEMKTAKEPLPHISPYSFFVDVSRGSRPMVAFAACPRSDEFVNPPKGKINIEVDGANRKDAQRDIEQTKAFCVNVVSEDLGWAMNASAAPLGKALSEFRLMGGGYSCAENDGDDGVDGRERRRRTIPTPTRAPTVGAPFVPQSPMFMECRHVKTVKVPEIFKGDSMCSVIIGEVLNIHIRKECLSSKLSIEEDSAGGNGGHGDNVEKRPLSVDLYKIRPVARLGYGQEYTIILED